MKLNLSKQRLPSGYTQTPCLFYDFGICMDRGEVNQFQNLPCCTLVVHCSVLLFAVNKFNVEKKVVPLLGKNQEVVGI